MRIVTVVAALVLAVLGGLVAVRAHAEDRPVSTPPASPVAAPVAPPPVLGVMGDSFAAGTGLGDPLHQRFPTVLADRIGWRAETTAVPGTGYVAHPPGTLPFDAGQVDRTVAAQPAVLVVEGSQNDRFADPRTVGPAATALYAHLRRALPATRIVVVGPVPSNSAQAAAMTELDRVVGTSARGAGLPYVDAIAEGWITDAQAPLIGADHIHPTVAGHARLADLLGADLTRLGVLPVSRT